MTAVQDRWATEQVVGAAARLAEASSVLAHSNIRLRRLDPEHPRVYAVADMSTQGKRRWWALASGSESGRIATLYRRAEQDATRPADAVEQVATALIHAVVGRATALLALEARVWDPGIDNLWIHLDSDVGIDWTGVVDPTLRVLASDANAGRPGVVTVPCVEALVMWTAHRCLTSLFEIRRALGECDAVDDGRFWGLVGRAVVGASSFVPVLGGSDQRAGWLRGQELLDAFVALGQPVRGQARSKQMT
ncbi:hypothetical protein GCM10007304_26060 [Rhodococcoides trifolii]|uniref:Iron reductase n=1 Tax=Rhodococcoides trifolii TaxID=908250 RepID=A0A917D6K7_9NOCA|nr:hypothetical protein [Rhodococcus trifolii]GGG10767.1 hypothetical protein GCM10007304_26060 [Rhodococcus trifolii]